MKNNEEKGFSLHDILQFSSSPKESSSKYELEEAKIKKALQERPSFSVKARLILIFLILLLISTSISVVSILLLSTINYRIQYVSLADSFANEIQHARRSEKNYFLYNSDLSEVIDQITKANGLLEQASVELGHVVGRIEIDSISQYLDKYQRLIYILREKEQDQKLKKSKEFKEIAQRLRNYGSKMLELSLDISKKERQLIVSTTERAKTINIILMLALIILSIFIASHIYRHIVLRLNILSDATRQFASGNFLPITPKRKYKDEFSRLAIALNHMMYELDKRQELLVESHKLRAIGNLTAGIAHELNNPLNNITLTSIILKDSYNEISDEERLDMINDIVNQGERANQVVRNLLDFVRESEIKMKYFSVNKLLDETIQLAKNQIKLSKVKLEEEIEENLPSIYGDRKLLIQVILNLFINAIGAMPDGGKLSIKAKENKEKNFISIQVSDTGSGIPDNILSSIFNPFFTTKASGKGTGLGLAVSKGIIEKHGGTIEVESKVNEGSVFTVYLPKVPIPADIKDKH